MFLRLACITDRRREAWRKCSGQVVTRLANFYGNHNLTDNASLNFSICFIVFWAIKDHFKPAFIIFFTFHEAPCLLVRPIKRIRLKQLKDGLFRKCSGRLFQQSRADGIKNNHLRQRDEQWSYSRFYFLNCNVLYYSQFLEKVRASNLVPCSSWFYTFKLTFDIIFCLIKLTNQLRDKDCSELQIELFRSLFWLILVVYFQVCSFLIDFNCPNWGSIF